MMMLTSIVVMHQRLFQCAELCHELFLLLFFICSHEAEAELLLLFRRRRDDTDDDDLFDDFDFIFGFENTMLSS